MLKSAIIFVIATQSEVPTRTLPSALARAFLPVGSGCVGACVDRSIAEYGRTVGHLSEEHVGRDIDCRRVLAGRCSRSR